VQVTIGLFAGIFNEEGKLLLRRRIRENPNIPCPHEGDWELPGGTVEETNVWRAEDERVIGEELAREVKEETGLSIETNFMPVMYPAIYINRQKKTIDLAFVIPVGIVQERPTIGEIIYVSPRELEELAKHPEGNQLVSGWGKRMCRMALMVLSNSPNPRYREEALSFLSEIQKEICQRNKPQ
jgi:8-oxo-dGTP pyrophosphatase MutT (NUDIX family)